MTFRPQDVRKAATSNKRRIDHYRISGDSVTLAEIAERLGITKVQVSTRLQRERQLPGCITWERLAR